jgi:repressor LexA
MLTKSQKKTYDFIKEYINREKISPTLKEISAGINIKSRGTICRYVYALIELGLIGKNKEKNTSRNLVLTDKSPLDILTTKSNNTGITDKHYNAKNFINDLSDNLSFPISFDETNFKMPCIPLIGVIAAGQPIEAINDADSFNINDILYGKDLYMLRIKGYSMIEEGINDGDYVICEPCATADNGEIVVALIDNQSATLKRIYKNDHGKILLCPANSNMKPQEYDASRVTVQGILRCQLRSYR